jgi:hypothetical protein
MSDVIEWVVPILLVFWPVIFFWREWKLKREKQRGYFRGQKLISAGEELISAVDSGSVDLIDSAIKRWHETLQKLNNE